MNLSEILEKSKKASIEMLKAPNESKNKFLANLSELLCENKTEVLFQNSRDTKVAKKDKKPDSFIDRLTLSQKRIFAITDSLKAISQSPDPIGKITEERKLNSGIFLKKMRMPLGVICMIFEARPNVVLDTAALAVKSGNAIVLRGSSDADFSNKALVGFVRKSLKKAGLPEDAVLLLEPDREMLKKALNTKGAFDVVIPRGGKELIDFVVDNSKAPVIETGASVVHLFVDESADIEKALEITENSKTRRVSICNALDTLLVHEKKAEEFLPKMASVFKTKVEMRCCKKALKILEPLGGVPVKEEDFDTEFLDFILNIKVVKDLDEAMNHIRKHSLNHTDCIVSTDKKNIERFLREVDSACVFANISTQFSDGGEFGLGAEIGISTQKLHTRGPFALDALTSEKWVLEGNGQVRSS